MCLESVPLLGGEGVLGRFSKACGVIRTNNYNPKLFYLFHIQMIRKNQHTLSNEIILDNRCVFVASIIIWDPLQKETYPDLMKPHSCSRCDLSLCQDLPLNSNISISRSSLNFFI